MKAVTQKQRRKKYQRSRRLGENEKQEKIIEINKLDRRRWCAWILFNLRVSFQFRLRDWLNLNHSEFPFDCRFGFVVGSHQDMTSSYVFVVFSEVTLLIVSHLICRCWRCLGKARKYLLSKSTPWHVFFFVYTTYVEFPLNYLWILLRSIT